MQPDRRAVLGGLALLLTAGMGAAATPRRRLAEELPPLDLEANIPTQFGNWSLDHTIVPVLPAPDVQDKLEKLYNNVLSRTYVNAQGQRIMFVIAYGADQADRMSLAHLPEACYSSQGFDIAGSEVAAVPINGRPFSLVRVRTRKGPRVEPVTYWTTVGDVVLVDEVSRRWARARYSLKGVIPDGMLVRVSSIDSDVSQAFGIQAKFVEDLYTGVSSATRERLFGSQT